MSVNITVASTRSGSGTERAPVRNSSTSPSTASESPAQGTWSIPGSSTYRAPGICEASSSPARRLTTRSPCRWRTSVGTWIVGRMARTSMSRNISKICWTIAGLAAVRSMRAVNSTAWGSSARLGAKSSTIPSACLPPVGGDELGGGLAKRLRGRGPGVVRRLRGAPHGAVEHQSGHALGMSGREQDAHRPALGDPEQGRPLGPGGVHDRPDVVDPLLERRHLGDGVGQPGAALVEDDQARERAEPLEEASERRRLPLELEVGGEAEHEDQVDRPVADDLVGDRGVAGLGVLGRRSAHPQAD